MLHFKKIMSLFLVFAMILGIFGTNSLTVKAATTEKVALDGMGSYGSLSIGGKTKTGVWHRMDLGGEDGFCLNLGKACHSGNIYEVTDSYTWTQATSGEKRGYYAKIFRWYDLVCEGSKKSFIMSQALVWSVAEGYNSEAQLKAVIKEVKDKTGFYSGKTVNQLYNTIFETDSSFTVKVKYWKKQGGSSSYQTLLTVEASARDYKPHKLSKGEYYRQRITLTKSDDLEKPLSGIYFQLDIKNYVDLYSASITGLDGTVDTGGSDNSPEFTLVGRTRANGTLAFRMTYYIENEKSAYYFTDSELNKMTADERKAAKQYLTNTLDLTAGVDFGPNMSKAEAEDLAAAQINNQIQSINNNYTLTETNNSAQPHT
ncbi:MAG: hypothetical protein K6G62_02715, partial [Eubacterium sp.]|nr:hypothetical protein [Eubacterium sp.]